MAKVITTTQAKEITINTDAVLALQLKKAKPTIEAVGRPQYVTDYRLAFQTFTDKETGETYDRLYAEGTDAISGNPVRREIHRPDRAMTEAPFVVLTKCYSKRSKDKTTEYPHCIGARELAEPIFKAQVQAELERLINGEAGDDSPI